MTHPGIKRRTTVALDEQSLRNLEFLGKLNGGISNATKEALIPVELYYHTDEFRFYGDLKEWLAIIIAQAHQLQRNEKSSSKAKKRKSIVIPPESL